MASPPPGPAPCARTRHAHALVLLLAATPLLGSLACDHDRAAHRADAASSASIASLPRASAGGATQDSSVATTSGWEPTGAELEASLRALGNEDSAAECARRREQARQQPAAPGAPAFEASRIAMVGRVRGAGSLWRREPRSGELPPELGEAVRALDEGRVPLRTVRDLLHRFRKSPDKLRQALLREGYLYAPQVESALALVQSVRLTSLFAEPELVLLRRGELLRLKRAAKERFLPERYVHVDGPSAGEPAELLFGDRLGSDEATLRKEPLTVELGSVQREEGFERIRDAHLASELLTAEIRWGSGPWVKALFDVTGPSARLACLAPEPTELQALARARAEALRRWRAHEFVRGAIAELVREQLPFDSPRGGLEDDQKFPLRSRWQDAYEHGLRSYRYGGRRYDVYDELGRPRVPEVCIDFVLDAWERASGTWFRGMQRKGPDGPLEPAPELRKGGLRMQDIGLANRRSVNEFLRFAAQHGEYFELWEPPESERPLYLHREPFFAALGRHVDELRIGDVLIFRRDKWVGRAMPHAALVVEIDPWSGVPSLLAGNAAEPAIQTFEGVNQTSPRRYLKLRVRPRAEWLAALLLRSNPTP